ncbi:MAG: B12-binding domain-containing radical SAM protein [Desulfurococcales archaeon]|nr:B12-binding domain-containing radical SAM protein [Desulfurococcales archaeon]MCE4621863.1 B12-binding domain-containing radical SAM protein [Desulfurococcales archaeon]
MRVLLTLSPGVHDLEIYKIMGMKAPPLGLAYLASVLERDGHKVRIIDSPTLELDIEGWLKEVKSWSPDVLGFSVLTPLAPKTYEAISRIREVVPNIPIVLGGPHPTFMYKEALENGADIVVLGEGEESFRDLVNTLERYGIDPSKLSGVRGLAYRHDGKVKFTGFRDPIGDLDKIPWPARHLLPMDRYTLFGKPIRVAHIMASRGCPFGCIYCSTSYFWGRRVRFRTPVDVADEIEYVADKYRVKYIVFTDDELLINKRFVRELLGELKSRGLDLPFACGARVDHLSRSIMRLLFENNCATIYVGVESASQETLNRIGKRITLEQARRVFEWKREIGGYMVASFILGFPWETIRDMENTIKLAIELDPDYAQFTVLTPYPGTPLFEYAKRHNLIEDWNWEHYTTIRPVMRGFKFTRSQLGWMLSRAYRKFYLRFSFIARELGKGRFLDILRVLGREVSRYVVDAVTHPIRWRVEG